MDKSADNQDWLQATDPALLATLHEIDRVKKCMRGHSPTVSRLFSSASSEWSGESDSNYASRPTECASSAATQAPKSRDWQTLNKSSPPQSLLSQQPAAQPRPKSDLTVQKEKEQLFLDRRAALYRPVSSKASHNSSIGNHAPTSRRGRHHVIMVEVNVVGVSASQPRLSTKEATEPQEGKTWRALEALRRYFVVPV